MVVVNMLMLISMAVNMLLLILTMVNNEHVDVDNNSDIQYQILLLMISFWIAPYVTPRRWWARQCEQNKHKCNSHWDRELQKAKWPWLSNKFGKVYPPAIGNKIIIQNTSTFQECSKGDCFHVFCVPIWYWTLPKVKESWWCWRHTIIAAVLISTYIFWQDLIH